MYYYLKTDSKNMNLFLFYLKYFLRVLDTKLASSSEQSQCFERNCFKFRIGLYTKFDTKGPE